MRLPRPVPRLSLAQPADVDGLAVLYARTGSDPVPDQAELRAWLKGGFELYAATLDGRLVGAVRCCFPVSTCYLDRLAVLPEDEGRGFGRYLIEHVLSRARRAGVAKVWARSPPRLEIAVSLLTEVGFQASAQPPAGTREGEMLLLELSL